MRFTLEEAKNLVKMLRSSDEENQYIAFQAIKESDLSDISTLLFLYKFGKPNTHEWQKHCLKALIALRKETDHLYELENLRNAECLYILTTCFNAPDDLVEAAVQYGVEQLTGFLKRQNYSKVDIQVKLEK